MNAQLLEIKTMLGQLRLSGAREKLEELLSEALKKELEHIQKIVGAYDDCSDVDKFMRIVEKPEIVENDYNLNISRYIDTSEPEEEVDLVAVKQTLVELEQREEEIDKKLNAFLTELGI